MKNDLSVTSQRNYGIDILKIVSILMIVSLHILGADGILNSCEVGSTQYYVSWFIEAISLCAVNCFAMSTGYLMLDKKYKTARIIPLWLQVTFYSVSIGIIMMLFSVDVTTKFWIKAFFPVSTGLYWYFSAYFCLFFLMPFINKTINSLSTRQGVFLCLVLTVFFSVMNIIRLPNVFDVQGGYECLWLIILYIFGACIKKFDLLNSIKKRWCVVAFSVATAISFASYMFMEKFSNSQLERIIGKDFLMVYSSPTMVISALALFGFCLKINVRKNCIKKSVTALSSVAFGVYIIHIHKLIWENCLVDAFVKFSEFNPIILALSVLAVTVGIYTACAVIELLRIKLFSILKIDKLCNFIGDKIDSKLKLGL